MATYAGVDDLRLVLDSTDAGTGTAAQLSDAQLELALQAATDRVTWYAGKVLDPVAVPSVASLTLDLAAWWATTYYLKQKDMAATHPVQLRYTEAVKVLEAVADGKISLDVTVPVAAGAKVINRIPDVFTGYDSDTVVVAGQLFTDTRPEEGPVPVLYGDWP